MLTVKYDTSETGWRTILSDYMADVLEKFTQEPMSFTMTSREAYNYENKQLESQGRSISRASIINGLNDMVDNGLLNYKMDTGKGGRHRVYSLAQPPRELEAYVVYNLLNHVKDVWPEAYVEVIPALED